VNFSYDACGNRIHQLYVEKEQKKDTGDSTYFSHDLLISNVVPDIIVFPNPTKEFIIVKSKEISFDGQYEAILSSSRGDRLKTITLDRDESCIDLSLYSSGIYVLSITSTSFSESWKIIKN
jgi:hypothetical protein